MIGKHRRQGDVLIIATDSVRGKPVAPSADGKVILAFGEVTGHHHRFASPEVHHYRDDSGGGTSFFEAPVDVPLVHEEHGGFYPPAPKFFQAHQFEYTPAELRRSVD